MGVTSNGGIRWGIRKPGQALATCAFCGAEFAQNKPYQRFCSREHTKAFYSSSEQFTIYKRKRAASFSLENKGLFADVDRQRTTAIFFDDEVGDYDFFYDDLLIRDETDSVLGDVERRIVWAKHAELSHPVTTPFSDIVGTFLSRIDKVPTPKRKTRLYPKKVIEAARRDRALRELWA